MTKSEGRKRDRTTESFSTSGFGFLSSFVIQRLVQVRLMFAKDVSEVVAALHEPRGAAGTFGSAVSPGSIYGGGETAGPEPPTPMFTPTGLILRENAREPSLMATVWTNVLTIRSAYLTSVRYGVSGT